MLRPSVVMRSIAALLFFTHAALAQTFFVKEGATGSGTSWDDARGTIPTGVLETDTKIYVAAGNYILDQQSTISRAGYLIQGGFSVTSTGTSLDSYDPAANVTHITKAPGIDFSLFRSNSGPTQAISPIVIKGIVFSNFQSSGPSGAILFLLGLSNNLVLSDLVAHDIQGNTLFYLSVFSGTTSVENCNFYSNSTLSNSSSVFQVTTNEVIGPRFRISNSIFHGNRSRIQATVTLNYFTAAEAILIQNSSFCNNSADNGALYIGSSVATISGCIFTGNSAEGQGITSRIGAIGLYGPRKVDIINCGFYGNVGSAGGAIYSINGPNPVNTVSNSIFFGNRANAGNGGAIYANQFSGSWTVTNSKFISNSAFGNGGAIAKGNARININESTFAQNTAASGADIMSDAGGESFYVDNSKMQLPEAESYVNASNEPTNYVFNDNNTFGNTDTEGVTDIGYFCPKSISFPVTVSGRVFNDANGLTDGIVNGTTDNLPYLTVTLMQGESIIERRPVVNGVYSFTNVAQGQYTLVLNISAPDRNLDADWVTTGENIGTEAGNDGVPDGNLAISVAAGNISNANFGINKLPVAIQMSPTINPVNSNAFVTLDGVEGNPDAPAGEDLEDGALGDGTMMIITSLPTQGELYYGDTLVALNTPFKLNSSTFRLKLTGAGYTSLSFDYAFIDAAGSQGPASTYTLNLTAPLPVTLATFSAGKEGTATILSWTTTSETRSDRFEILHSQEGKSWQRVGEVKAAGESHTTGRYSFIHQNPSAGENLYRLRMVDTDGSAALSRIISLNFESVAQVSMYPNPVADMLTLQFSDWASISDIRILNFKGAEVYRSGKNPARQIDVKSLQAGMYIVKATRKDGSFVTRKIVINR